MWNDQATNKYTYLHVIDILQPEFTTDAISNKKKTDRSVWMKGIKSVRFLPLSSKYRRWIWSALFCFFAIFQREKMEKKPWLAMHFFPSSKMGANFLSIKLAGTEGRNTVTVWSGSKSTYIQLSKSDQWSLQLGLIYLLNTDKKINRNRKERKVQKSYFFAVSKLKRHFPPVVFTPVQSNLLPDYVFLFSYSHIRFLWLASTPSGKTSRNFEEKYLFNKTNIVQTQLVINLRTPNLWTLQGDRTLACVLHAMKSSLWLAIIEENQTNIQMLLTISPFQI